MNVRQQLIRSCAQEMGLSLVMPEPEVLAADLSQIRCRTLADLIGHLISEHEPALRAKVDGATVSVRVIGERETMRFTVTEGDR